MTPAQSITVAMKGRWRGGGDGYGMIRCPAHPDRNPSCRVRNGERAPLVSCYGGCEPRSIIAELKRLGVWPEQALGRAGDCRAEQRTPRRSYAHNAASPLVPRHLSDDDKTRIVFAREIWEATLPAAGSIVEPYWHEARGLALSIPRVIRFGAAVPYGYDQPGRAPVRRLPAMVAKVDAPDGTFAGVHVTFLANDGSDKRRDLPNDRLVFGCVAGGAIRLAEAVDELAIGEGIESTASYMQEFGVAGWAAMNTSGIRAIILPPPPIAFLVTFLGENDEPKGPRKVVASAAAIADATARLRLEGRLVGSVFPAEEFKDFNDPHRRAA